MKLTVWMVTRERGTWISAAEVFGLAVLLVTGAPFVLRVLVGLPLLGHLGYSALTSLPLGLIPGRPEGGQHRRNLDLRARVKVFLDQVKRADEYAQRAEVSGLPKSRVEKDLGSAAQRIMTAAAEVAKVARRPDSAPASPTLEAADPAKRR